MDECCSGNSRCNIWNTAIGIYRYLIFIPAFFFRKKSYSYFVPKSVRRPSVRPSATFLLNVSPSKPLDVETFKFVPE